MFITGTGSVGIGTTSPGAKLEIDGNIKLTAGSGASITFQDGTTQTTAYTGGGGMVYPGAGVPNSTGSAWGTSYAVGPGDNDLVQLTSEGALPAVSAANLIDFPVLNQNTTGTAANLSGTPVLPNGTTATTQAIGTNNTELATTAFVIANAGSGGGAPATNPTGGANNYASIASPTFTGGMAVASDGVHAGYVTLPGETANFAVAPNTTGWMGPPSASFTAYALQLPFTAPVANSVLIYPAPTSSIALGTFTNAPALSAANMSGYPAATASTAGVATLPIKSYSFTEGTPGGAALNAGVIGYATVPAACTIKSWSIEVNAGTATVKTLKVATGKAIPTLASNSISTDGESISMGTVIQSTTLTDFTTTTISANDILGADLITTSGVSYINFQVNCQ